MTQVQSSQKTQRYQPVLEPVQPKINLTKRIGAFKWVVLGLDSNGNMVQLPDEFGGVRNAYGALNEKWYILRGPGVEFMHNPAIEKVWIGQWSEKMGRYTFDGEALAELISLAAAPGAAPGIAGHAELVALAKTATATAKSSKEKKAPVPAEFPALFNGLLAAAKSSGMTREQAQGMIAHAFNMHFPATHNKQQ